jgi:hypothetical protein
MKKSILVLVAIVVLGVGIWSVWPAKPVALAPTVDPVATTPVPTVQMRCFSRTQVATKTAPYSSTEHITLTIDGSTVSGTKTGTQSGPDMTNGFTGTLAGTLKGSDLELMYSYVVEGSKGREVERYQLTDTSLTKQHYVLKEDYRPDGLVLVPDQSKLVDSLVYTTENCLK